ncbi:MAG: hypothetical protein J1F22_01575 [Lachnospiraceae bacterium]|nr:hypothetical protein [Lachnospiraceae bacterium]
MVDVYNLYLGGYLPKVSPKTNVHNKRELKSKYKSIVSLNNANPLVMIKLSNDTQAYALNVKEMSMELGEAAQDVLEQTEEDMPEKLENMAGLFNKLLARSDEFGEKNGRPSRPGGELRNLVDSHSEELVQSGFSIDSRGFLTAPKGDTLSAPKEFAEQLREKCDHMSMNPMEYVERKVYSYAHLYRNDIGAAYESSIYSGMLFNSYC